jgi:hypothetical protein
MPRLTDYDRKKYFELRIDKNYSNRAACAEMGISEGTGLGWWRNRGGSEARRRALMENPPDPKPYDELHFEVQRCVREFPAFDRRYFPEFHFAPWSARVAESLSDWYYSEEDEWTTLEAPPGSGKSTILHRILTWIAVRERTYGREPTILVGHRAERMAKRYVSRIRHWLEFKAQLVEDFGRFKPRQTRGVMWSAEEFLVEPLTWEDRQEKEPTVSAGSYDGALLSGRFKVVAWDDLLDKANSSSADQRKQVIDWWEQEAETRLEPGGLGILSGARYGPDDLVHHVTSMIDPDEMENEEPRRLYHRLRFPAHDDALCNGREHLGPWPKGCLLDPQRLNYKKLRNQMIKNEGRYRLIFQQEDVDPEGFLADPVWFVGGEDSKGWRYPGCFDRERMFGQLPKKDTPPALSCITADPASTRFWAVVHWLGYRDGTQAVLNAVRRPMSAPELLYGEVVGGRWQFSGYLEDFYQDGLKVGHAPRYVIVETRAAQTYLLQYPFVREWAQQRGVTLIPHDTNRSNKADPNFGVQASNGPVYKEGRLRLPYAGYEEKLFADNFQREAVSFPEGATSDIVMAHWFYTFRLPQLLTAETEEPESSDLPEWITDSGVPGWARDSLTAAR